MSQACCEPVLQTTTEQWGMHFAQTGAALHFCCLTAHLYEEQVFIGAIAVSQACCEPVLQSSTEQQGSSSALTSAAVLWCWVTAHLSGEQISIGAIAVAQACCEPVLAEQHRTVRKLFCLDQCCSALVLHHCTPV